MQNGTGNEETTRKSDPAIEAILAVADQLQLVGKRLAEAAQLVRGITGPSRFLALRDVCRLIRDSGDGCHDMARSVERHLKGNTDV